MYLIYTVLTFRPKKTKTIVSGLRTRHFQTSTSMGFFVKKNKWNKKNKKIKEKKFTLFFSFKYCNIPVVFQPKDCSIVQLWCADTFLLQLLVISQNLHLKNEKACNCDNLRKFLLLFISHIFFFWFPISLKPALGYACNSISIWRSIQFCNFYVQAMCLHIKVAELNTPSDGNGAYHH